MHLLVVCIASMFFFIFKISTSNIIVSEYGIQVCDESCQMDGSVGVLFDNIFCEQFCVVAGHNGSQEYRYCP